MRGRAAAGTDRNRCAPIPSGVVGWSVPRAPVPSTHTMLDTHALVLNQSWTPISTTTVRRAILLMARGAAGAVHPETYEVANWGRWIRHGTFAAGRLRAIGFDFPIPEVIVLHQYNGYPDVPVAFARRNVYRRDAYQCMYCGRRPHPDHLTIDHVIPRSRGGAHVWENCVTACLDCNAKKADRTLREARMHLLVPPRVPEWPGGMDPNLLSECSTWQRFLPERWRRMVVNS